MVATIISWSAILDWVAFRFPRVSRFIRPEPLAMVKNGVMLRRNMRRELITEEELMAQLRQQGVEDLDGVKAVHMEGDGQFSVITGEPAQQKAKQKAF